jgi:hypothetical protein
MIAITQIPRNFPLFAPCIVIQLCNANRQNALFNLMFFKSIPLVFYTFITSYVHLQQDYIVHTVLCYVIHVEITVIIVYNVIYVICNICNVIL